MEMYIGFNNVGLAHNLGKHANYDDACWAADCKIGPDWQFVTRLEYLEAVVLIGKAVSNAKNEEINHDEI